jgi:hypothetical protein
MRAPLWTPRVRARPADPCRRGRRRAPARYLTVYETVGQDSQGRAQFRAVGTWCGVQERRGFASDGDEEGEPMRPDSYRRQSCRRRRDGEGDGEGNRVRVFEIVSVGRRQAGVQD